MRTQPLGRLPLAVAALAVCAGLGGCSGVLTWKSDPEAGKAIGELAGTFLGMQPGTAAASGLGLAISTVFGYFAKRNADRAAEAENKRREDAAARVAEAREREAALRRDAEWYESQLVRTMAPVAAQPVSVSGGVPAVAVEETA